MEITKEIIEKGLIYKNMKDARNVIKNLKAQENKNFRKFGFKRWNCEIGVIDEEIDQRKDGLFTTTTRNRAPSKKDLLEVIDEAFKDGLTNFTVFFTASLDVSENILEWMGGIYEPSVAYVDVDLFKYKS